MKLAWAIQLVLLLLSLLCPLYNCCKCQCTGCNGCNPPLLARAIRRPVPVSETRADELQLSVSDEILVFREERHSHF